MTAIPPIHPTLGPWPFTFEETHVAPYLNPGVQELYSMAKNYATGGITENDPMDPRLLESKFLKLYKCYVASVAVRGVQDTPLGLCLIQSFDPHMTDCSYEDIEYVSKDAVMSEPPQSDKAPPRTIQRRKKKFTYGITHSALLNVSLRILAILREKLASETNDAHTMEPIARFGYMMQDGMRDLISSMRAGNMANVAEFMRDISPDVAIMHALWATRLQLQRAPDPNRICQMKCQALNTAARQFRMNLFSVNIGPYDAVLTLADRCSQQCDRLPFIREWSKTDQGSIWSGAKDKVNAAIAEAELQMRKTPSEAVGLYIKRMKELLLPSGRELLDASNVLCVMLTGPETYHDVARDRQMYRVLIDLRRGVLRINKSEEQMIAHTGIMVLNIHSNKETIRDREPTSDEYISIMRGPIDTNGKPTETLFSGNDTGYTVKEFPGMLHRDGVVLFSKDLSDVTDVTRRVDRDVTRDMLHVTQTAPLALCSQLDYVLDRIQNPSCTTGNQGDPHPAKAPAGKQRLQVPRSLTWKTYGEREETVSALEALRDVVFNPEFFNYVDMTEKYNRPSTLHSSGQKGPSAKNDQITHTAGVWDVFPPERRKALCDLFADHPLQRAILKIKKTEGPMERTYGWTCTNRDVLPLQRSVSHVDHTNYHEPASVRLLHDQPNPFQTMHFIPKGRQMAFRDWWKTALGPEQAGIREGTRALFTPRFNLENIPLCLRPLSGILDAGENIARTHYTELLDPAGESAEAARIWSTSLNHSHQDMLCKYWEATLIARYASDDALIKGFHAKVSSDTDSVEHQYVIRSAYIFSSCRGVLACDSNMILLKAIATLPLSRQLRTYEPLKQLQAACEIILRLTENVATSLIKRLAADLQALGHAQLAAKLGSNNGAAFTAQEVITLRERSQEISGCTDLAIPTPVPMGVVGSNMWSQINFETSEDIHCYAWVPAADVPEDQSAYGYSKSANTLGARHHDLIYMKHVKVDKNVCQTATPKEMIQMKTFYSIMQQLCGSTMTAVKIHLDKDSMDTITENQRNLLTMHTANSREARQTAPDKDIKKHYPKHNTVFRVSALPAVSLRMKRNGNADYRTETAFCIDGVMVKNAADLFSTVCPIEGRTFEPEYDGSTDASNLLAKQEAMKDVKCFPLPLSLEVMDVNLCFTLAKAKGIMPNDSVRRHNEVDMLPDICLYSSAHHPVQRDGMHSRRVALSQLSPEARVMIMPVQQTYATAAGLCALAKQAGHATIGCMLVQEDKLETEHMFAVTPASIWLRQGPMHMLEACNDSESATRVDEMLRFSETRGGTSGLVLPHAKFTGNRTDGAYNPRIPWQGIGRNARNITSDVATLYVESARAYGSSMAKHMTASATGSDPLRKTAGYVQGHRMFQPDRDAGRGQAEKSTTDILLIPNCMPLEYFSYVVNVRNPGKSDAFQDCANELTRSQFFTGETSGLSNPWGSLPFSLAFVGHSATNVGELLRMPKSIAERSPVVNGMDYGIRELLENMELGHLGRKRKNPGDNDTIIGRTVGKGGEVRHTHISPMSLSTRPEQYRHLSHVLGGAVPLDARSAPHLSSETQMWGVPLRFSDGNYILRGLGAALFSSLSTERRKV